MAIYKGTGQNRKKIAENNVQSDWSEENINSSAFIKNKPEIADVISGKADKFTKIRDIRLTDFEDLQSLIGSEVYNIDGSEIEDNNIGMVNIHFGEGVYVRLAMDAGWNGQGLYINGWKDTNNVINLKNYNLPNGFKVTDVTIEDYSNYTNFQDKIVVKTLKQDENNLDTNLIDVYTENVFKPFSKMMKNDEFNALQNLDENTIYIVTDKQGTLFEIDARSNPTFYNALRSIKFYTLLTNFPYDSFSKTELKKLNFYIKGMSFDTWSEVKLNFGKIIFERDNGTAILLFRPIDTSNMDIASFGCELLKEETNEFSDGTNVQVFNNPSSPIDVPSLTTGNFTVYKTAKHGNRHQFCYFTPQGWDTTGIYAISETRDIGVKFFEHQVNSVNTTILNNLPVVNGKMNLNKTKINLSTKSLYYNEDEGVTTGVSGTATPTLTNANYQNKISFRAWSGETFTVNKVVYINNTVWSEENSLNTVMSALDANKLGLRLFYNE